MTIKTIIKPIDVQVESLTNNEKFTAPLNAYQDLESTTRKSLYGKAKMIKGFSFVALTSYMSPIMVVDDDGHITIDKEYYDYTITTRRHTREFLKHLLSIGYLKSDVDRDDDHAVTEKANQILAQTDDAFYNSSNTQKEQLA